MLPTGGNNGWSTEHISGVLLYPRQAPKRKLFAQCLMTRSKVLRTAEVAQDIIYLYEADGVTPELTITGHFPLNIDLTFDQNDRPMLTWYEEGDKVFIHWYDPILPGYTMQQIAEGTNPCCMMDEVRILLSSGSDNFLFYQKPDGIYYRFQQERYLVEHLVPDSGSVTDLETCGLAENGRMTLRFLAETGTLLAVGDNPIMLESAYVGYYEGIAPWPKSSSNTTT